MSASKNISWNTQWILMKVAELNNWIHMYNQLIFGVNSTEKCKLKVIHNRAYECDILWNCTRSCITVFLGLSLIASALWLVIHISSRLLGHEFFNCYSFLWLSLYSHCTNRTKLELGHKTKKKKQNIIKTFAKQRWMKDHKQHFFIPLISFVLTWIRIIRYWVLYKEFKIPHIHGTLRR